MKLLLSIILISFAFSNALLLRPQDSSPFDIEKAPENLEAFFTAYYAHFELGQPKQLLRCYDRISSDLFFKHLHIVADLVEHAERREKHKVHLDFVKLAVLGKALQRSGNCVAQTQDLQDLYNKLNITNRDPQVLGIISYIHFQASIGELAVDMPKIISAIDNKDFTEAGELSAVNAEESLGDVNNKGTSLLALKGLWNGVHIGLELPDAASILQCWNNETASVRLEFVYGLAHAVAEGSAKDAAYNTEKWYEEKGKELLGKIPAEAWECWKNSDDTKKESERLKVDITSDEFHEKGKKFVLSHQVPYWKLQKIIKENLEQHNFIHAGSAYASLLEAIAATKLD